MSMLDFAIRATTEYIDHMPKSQRKNSLQVRKLLFLWLGYLKFLMGVRLSQSLILVLVLEYFQLHYWSVCNLFRK